MWLFACYGMEEIEGDWGGQVELKRKITAHISRKCILI